MSFSKLMTLSQLKAIGVRDERWTVHDKLLMYKGLTKIYSKFCNSEKMGRQRRVLFLI